MASHWIVIGAGSAGCVLANRLSEDSRRQVTLLEAGPNLLPGEVPPSIDGPSFYAALDEPERSYPAIDASRTNGGDRTPYQRGRGIGGSSAVNAMVALAGSSELYRSWGWDDIDKATKRIAVPTELAQRDEVGPVDRALLAADERTTLATMTRRDGRRVTSAEAYLWPALDRANLTVQANTEAELVVLRDRRVTGVRLSNGSEIAADRVVLAAGAIHSPTILLRSGIVTEGIGEGLQDHPSATFVLELRPDAEQNQASLACGSVLHADIAGNLIQLLPLSSVGVSPESAGYGALLTALMTPRGRSGRVAIDSSGKPVVDFDLLADERDLAALISGVRFALDVVHSASFDDVVSQVLIDDQGTSTNALSSDAAIAAWLAANCGDYVHATSTCAMGTVVDHRGAVRGHEGLYVCDASVFPTIPDANTHLPTTMLAELMCTPKRLLADN